MLFINLNFLLKKPRFDTWDKIVENGYAKAQKGYTSFEGFPRANDHSKCIKILGTAVASHCISGKIDRSTGSTVPCALSKHSSAH